MVIWAMTPCSNVVGYQHFGGPCWLHFQGGGSMVSQNVDILHHYMVS